MRSILHKAINISCWKYIYSNTHTHTHTHLISCSPDEMPNRSSIVHRNFAVQSSSSFHGPWFIGNGFRPSNSNKCPSIGTKLTKWNASPVNLPVLKPVLLSSRRLACVIACELWAQANSGVFPIAHPLFSGLMPLVCAFSRASVSPRSKSEQLSKTESRAWVAQLFGTGIEMSCFCYY